MPLTALAERTAYVDHLVTEQASNLPAQGFSLLAVGGYGRRHLFPYSDIDLLLLFESERLAHASKDAISQVPASACGTRACASASPSARPAECVEVHDLNAELNVSLLDQRYLAGDRTLYGDLARRLPRFLQCQPRGPGPQPRPSRPRAPRQVRRHLLSPRAGREGDSRRPARLQLVCWLEHLREGGPAEPSARAARRLRLPGPHPLPCST